MAIAKKQPPEKFKRSGNLYIMLIRSAFVAMFIL